MWWTGNHWLHCSYLYFLLLCMGLFKKFGRLQISFSQMTCGIIFMSLYFWSDNRAVFQITALVIHCLTIIRTCKTFPRNGPPGTGFVNRPHWIQLHHSSPPRWGHAEAPRWFGRILKLNNKTNTHATLWGNVCSGLACEDFAGSSHTNS